MNGFESVVKQIDWWIYVIIVCVVLIIILILNYIVKKFNEARLEKRIDKTHHKSSVHQAVQFEDQIETKQTTSPDVEKMTPVLDKKEENLEVHTKPKEKENIIDVTTENVKSPEKDVGLNTPQSPEEKTPTYLGEIYQERRESIPQKDSNLIDELIAASIRNSPCATHWQTDNETSKQTEKEPQDIRNEKMRITETFSDEAKSSNEESNAKTDKVEQNKEEIVNLEICKTCSEKDSSKEKEKKK